MTQANPTMPSSAAKWIACAHRHPVLVLIGVWIAVACFVVSFAQWGFGAEVTRQVLVSGLAVLVSSLAGLWVTARLAPVSARGAIVAGAPLIAGIALRLVLLMVLLFLLMFVLKWNQEAVGFGAIAWYLPLLAIEGWLVSNPSHDSHVAAICQESPS